MLHSVEALLQIDPEHGGQYADEGIAVRGGTAGIEVAGGKGVKLFVQPGSGVSGGGNVVGGVGVAGGLGVGGPVDGAGVGTGVLQFSRAQQDVH